MADEIKITAELPKVESKQFNFNQPPELMDPLTWRAFYALRRVALIDSNEKGLPDGKTISEAEVVKILGPDLTKAVGLAVPPGLKEPVKKTDVVAKEN